MLYLKFHLNSDYSGCRYTLMMGDIVIKTWNVMYGYNNPAWQQQKRSDKERMEQELYDLGLCFENLEVVYD